MLFDEYSAEVFCEAFQFLPSDAAEAGHAAVP